MVIAQGQPMLASDINNLTFFPAGTILIFSGSAYTGASADFKVIWKVCNGQNGTPNLVGKFLRGAESSGSEYSNPTTTNTQSIILATGNLPAHSHSATGLSVSGLSVSGLSFTSGSATSAGAHEHSLSGGAASAGSHTHAITDPGHIHTLKPVTSVTGGSSTWSSSGGGRGAGYADIPSSTTGISIDSDGAHTHSFSTDSKAASAGAHTHTVTGTISGGTISGGTISGATANAGSGSAFTVNTMPSYYTVIYIMKVA